MVDAKRQAAGRKGGTHSAQKWREAHPKPIYTQAQMDTALSETRATAVAETWKRAIEVVEKIEPLNSRESLHGRMKRIVKVLEAAKDGESGL